MLVRFFLTNYPGYNETLQTTKKLTRIIIDSKKSRTWDI